MAQLTSENVLHPSEYSGFCLWCEVEVSFCLRLHWSDSISHFFAPFPKTEVWWRMVSSLLPPVPEALIFTVIWENGKNLYFDREKETPAHRFWWAGVFLLASISIPQVSRNTIRSLAYTVMLSTSAAHRLSSNPVMSFGRSLMLSMNRSIFLRSCCPLPSSECGAGECEGRAALFHISLLYHYFLL